MCNDNIPLISSLSLLNRVDKIISVQKKLQCRHECDVEVNRILRSKERSKYPTIRPKSDPNQTLHEVDGSIDGSWHNKIYSRSSKNGCAVSMERYYKKVFHVETRSKGHNYPIDASSGSMETDILRSTIKYMHSRMIHFNKIAVDGDSKVPALTRELNDSAMVKELSPIVLKADRAHSKKNLPKKLMAFKTAYDWSGTDYDLSGFTVAFTRFLTDVMFQFSFHDPKVKTVEQGNS